MPKILVVDDHPINRQFLVKLLGYYGYELLEAADGVEGLKVAELHAPDLIITDNAMPRMSGEAFIRRLRETERSQTTPILIYTASHGAQHAQRIAEQYGVAAVLHKAAKPQQIIEQVARVLGPPPAPERKTRTSRRPGSWPGLPSFPGHKREVSEALRLAALAESALYLTTETTEQGLVDKFSRAVSNILDATIAGIVIPDPEGQQAPFSAIRHPGSDEGSYPRPHVEMEIFPQLLGKLRSGRLERPSIEPCRLGLPAAQAPLQSLVAAYIPVGGIPEGDAWMFAADKVGGDPFTMEDERLLVTLATQVSVAFENARLHARAVQRTQELEHQIAGRLRAEHSFKESQNRLAAIVDSAMDAIITVGSDQRVLLFNGAAEKVFRLSANEAIGQPLDRFIPERYRLVHREHVKRFGRTGQSARRMGALGAISGLRANGEEFPIEASISNIEIAGEQLFTVILRDVSERKQLEDQYRQAQKMEAVGRLAGGVAHDFNNLLTIINGYSELLLEGLPRGDPAKKMIAEIKGAGERAVGLTRQLLAFSRKQVLVLVRLDLNGLLSEMGKMLKRLIGEDIELTVRTAPDLWPIRADPGQIEQIVMNLVVNARDAMPQGGNLTIETRNVELSESYRETHPEVEPGRYVQLSVADSGCGMDAATRARAFEPFFSTKGEKGTGLGLATVYGIVKQSGGHVEVYSEPGLGSTFKIYLPEDKSPGPTRKSSHLPQRSLRGTETILVVEDEAGVRALTRQILQNRGYTVLEAENGVEALAVSGQHAGPIHLLLTDVVMPQMSGRELAVQLTKLRPETRTLYLSGYTDDAIVRHGVLEASMSFLQKPFSSDSLARMVREVLDQNGEVAEAGP